ncbi:lysophospholipid acyltransferase family protein [Acuticoccus sp.]|uniref:lysophospholipid acyltransferase family protein n=1 Tax=Acuticoccus sp. TaxID=1904378 RepID=UPI003B51DE5B
MMQSRAPVRPRAAVRSGPAHVLALARTALYSVAATTFFILTTLAFAFTFALPPDRMRFLLSSWAAGDVLLLRLIVGQRTAILGRENIPQAAALVAVKHQSAWETLALVPLLPRGAVILKKELLSIPLYGWYARYFGMIPVDRAAGPAALRQLVKDAAVALRRGAQIVIYPEGTRRPIGAPPDYKPGAIFLYEKLDVPMVPVALNSGLLWPHGRYVKYPGTITVSFLPAIPPGLKRAEVQRRLREAIEAETDRLVAAAQAAAR